MSVYMYFSFVSSAFIGYPYPHCLRLRKENHTPNSFSYKHKLNCAGICLNYTSLEWSLSPFSKQYFVIRLERCEFRIKLSCCAHPTPRMWTIPSKNPASLRELTWPDPFNFTHLLVQVSAILSSILHNYVRIEHMRYPHHYLEQYWCLTAYFRLFDSRCPCLGRQNGFPCHFYRKQSRRHVSTPELLSVY